MGYPLEMPAKNLQEGEGHTGALWGNSAAFLGFLPHFEWRICWIWVAKQSWIKEGTKKGKRRNDEGKQCRGSRKCCHCGAGNKDHASKAGIWYNLPAKSVLALTACVCMLCRFSRVWLFVTLWTVTRQAPLSMGFSRQKYCSGLPCPPPGDLPDPGIEPTSPALQAGSSPLSHLPVT